MTIDSKNSKLYSFYYDKSKSRKHNNNALIITLNLKKKTI